MMVENIWQPLLRAPPFPWADAHIASDGTPSIVDDLEPEALFAEICTARIGGDFWLPALAAERQLSHIIIVRWEADIDAARTLLAAAKADAGTLWVLPATREDWVQHAEAQLRAEGFMVSGPVDPWSILSQGLLKVIAHGDDAWAALAHMAGHKVQYLSSGVFGAAEWDQAKTDVAIARALKNQRYRNPFTGEDAALRDIVTIMSHWRRDLEGNQNIAVASGMAWWKRQEISQFLWSPQRDLYFRRHSGAAMARAKKEKAAIAIWPSRVSSALLEQAKRDATPVVRVEDGFIRSLGLGVNLVPPSSIVVDHRGIHFDPSQPSDLEFILQNKDFGASLLNRAQILRQKIIAARISKYSVDDTAADAVPIRLYPDRPLILVPGQVEDDMSVLAGAPFASNLELLRRARAAEPNAEIWFRPHPDVDSGHRKGKVEDSHASAYADQIVRGGGMAALLDRVDAVHTLTSLTGFEALMRGLSVTCHGMPFYAGWGLTRDLTPAPERRQRQLSLDELVAGVLILYPRYLDPVTGLPCPPEMLVERMLNASTKNDHTLNRLHWVAPIRRWQGRLMAKWR